MTGLALWTVAAHALLKIVMMPGATVFLLFDYSAAFEVEKPFVSEKCNLFTLFFSFFLFTFYISKLWNLLSVKNISLGQCFSVLFIVRKNICAKDYY